MTSLVCCQATNIMTSNESVILTSSQFIMTSCASVSVFSLENSCPKSFIVQTIAGNACDTVWYHFFTFGDVQQIDAQNSHDENGLYPPCAGNHVKIYFTAHSLYINGLVGD